MRFVKVLFVALLAVGCAPPPPADPGPDSGDAKAAARGYIERMINGHEWDAWDEYFGETVVFNGHAMSKDDMTGMAETFATILDGFRMEIDEQIAEGDRVATRVTIHGTHTGDYMGLKASGKEVSFGGLALDRLEDGKIVESWHQMDIWGTLLMASDD